MNEDTLMLAIAKALLKKNQAQGSSAKKLAEALRKSQQVMDATGKHGQAKSLADVIRLAQQTDKTK